MKEHNYVRWRVRRMRRNSYIQLVLPENSTWSHAVGLPTHFPATHKLTPEPPKIVRVTHFFLKLVFAFNFQMLLIAC